MVRGQRPLVGSAEWPAGKGVLQEYAPVALERNPALAELIPKFRDAITGAPRHQAVSDPESDSPEQTYCYQSALPSR